MSGALVLDPGKPAAMEEENNIDDVDSADGEMVSLLVGCRSFYLLIHEMFQNDVSIYGAMYRVYQKGTTCPKQNSLFEKLQKTNQCLVLKDVTSHHLLKG